MTTRNEQLIAAMSEAITVLRTNGLDSWALTLTRLRNDYEAEPSPSNRCNPRGLFGGSGSPSDLVLTRNRVPLIAENDALDRCQRQRRT